MQNILSSSQNSFPNRFNQDQTFVNRQFPEFHVSQGDQLLKILKFEKFPNYWFVMWFTPKIKLDIEEKN